jgi:hypothetical protein
VKKIGVFSALLLVAVTTTAQTPADALEDKQCDYRAHAAFNTGVAQALRAPLNNSAQLCASAAGFQNKATMAGNGQPFSISATTL